MRVALWSAVSTPSQAKPDKVSIQLQLEKGRAFIAEHGYTPAGEYTVPGESRTRYISLYHAEKEIPQLHHLLEAASRREFDVLFVYDLNRFRSLMRQIFDVLCDYGIQIYIHTHPREPVEPSAYNDDLKAAVGMIVDLSNIISRSEISSLQRHFREKMPARIQRGLHAGLGTPPYGYRRAPEKQSPYVLVPAQAAVLRRMKDWYLSGNSLKGIAKNLNSEGIPASFGGIWYPESVRILLASPFYAGLVYFGVHKYSRDRRSGQERITLNDAPLYAKGSHVPIWDEDTHRRILETMRQRGRKHRGLGSNRFTSLLRCECGKTLHRGSNEMIYWHCSSKQPGHTFITEKKALAVVIPEIVNAIRNAERLPLPQPPQDESASLESEIKELEKIKKKWLDLYEAEALDLPTLQERLNATSARLDQSRSLLAKSRAITSRQNLVDATFLQLRAILDHLPDYYLTAPAPQVNTDLRTIIESITIHKDHTLKINWK